MSSVMRPSGPLPPRVYWVRRLISFGLIVVVLLAVWWVTGRVFGAGDRAQAAQQSSSSPQSGQTTDGSTAAPPNKAHRSHHHGKPSRGPVSPSGPCIPADVAMTVVAPDVRSGHASTIRLQLESATVSACTLAITPDSLALRIMSGQDLIWSSDSCPDQLPAKQLVVHRHPATVYSFTWDGRRSTDSCRAPGDIARQGGYWAEAALIGAGVHKAYFDVT